MGNTSIILEKLKRLNLDEYPVKEITDLISELGDYGQLIANIPIGTNILRARINKSGEEFYSKNQLSYPPKNINTQYQRASIPGKTMFYGTVCPDEYGKKEEDWLEITTLCEISELLRNDLISEGEQIVTFSGWSLAEKIPVASTMYKFDKLISNWFLKKLQSDFEQQLNTYSNYFTEKTRLICDFFDNEFSKENTRNDFDYLISALYSDKLTQSQEASIAGVLYPSVRIKQNKGKGFNIAITPEYADKCLILQSVVECTVYKKNGCVLVDGDKIAKIENGKNEFKLEAITNPEHRLGKDKVYEYLNKQKPR